MDFHLHDFLFSHERVYPNMVVKSIQIHREMGLKVKKLKLDITIPGKTLSPVPTIIPKAKKNYLSPPVKGGEGCENLFENVLLEECTFCWKVLLVTLSKNLVTTITEFCHYLLMS